ncbi:MAG: hypothetical protein HQL31_11415 [Planctomycetes bacterium]|nr:hypothetical protein [Planctomycetota bacterium]
MAERPSKRSNCWQVMGCERQLGGKKANERGICPAAKMNEHHSKNGGEAGGRYCWKLAGTLCGGRPQGSVVIKIDSCRKCRFYNQVREEEADSFIE